MHIVTVDFRIKPEHRIEFMQHMLENARQSVQQEPGCRQFDVAVSETDNCAVFLYEVYDDKAAFVAHTRQPHFLDFNQATKDWVESKGLREFALCE